MTVESRRYLVTLIRWRLLAERIGLQKQAEQRLPKYVLDIFSYKHLHKITSP